MQVNREMASAYRKLIFAFDVVHVYLLLLLSLNLAGILMGTSLSNKGGGRGIRPFDTSAQMSLQPRKRKVMALTM